MTVSRRMDSDEFNLLARQEFGGTIMAHKLKPIAFNPPTRGNLDPDDPYEKDGFTVILLNVLDPAFYKDPRDGEVIFVLPKTQIDEFTYEFMAGVHPKSDEPWGYRLSPRFWDATDQRWGLDDALWYFKYEDEDMDYDLGEVDTH